MNGVSSVKNEQRHKEGRVETLIFVEICMSLLVICVSVFVKGVPLT